MRLPRKYAGIILVAMATSAVWVQAALGWTTTQSSMISCIHNVGSDGIDRPYGQVDLSFTNTEPKPVSDKPADFNDMAVEASLDGQSLGSQTAIAGGPAVTWTTQVATNYPGGEGKFALKWANPKRSGTDTRSVKVQALTGCVPNAPIVAPPAPPAIVPVEQPVSPPPPPTLISVKKMILLQLRPGRFTAWRITVTNNGLAPVRVTVTDPLSGKLALGRRVKHATVENGTITWRFSLQPGQSRSVGFYAWVYRSSRGAVCNTAYVRAADGARASWRDCAGIIPPATHKPPVTPVTG